MGDTLLGVDETLIVQSVARHPGTHRVYNLTVEGEHVYRVSTLGALVHNNDCNLTRRTQTDGDVTLASERAALREALRRHDVATSQANNYSRRADWDRNPNISGPQGEPAEFIDATNLHNKPVEIPHHKWGHEYLDDGSYELPHFQGPNGEHISYGSR